MALTADQIKDLSRPKPWKFWSALALDYFIIGSCLAACVWWRNYVVYLLAMITIGARQHALVVLAHECLHNVAFKNQRLNRWVGNIFCFGPTFLSLAHFKNFHLTHHRHLNTKLDPELEYRAFFDFFWRLPFGFLRVLFISIIDVIGVGIMDSFYIVKFMKIESIFEIIYPYIFAACMTFIFFKLDLIIVPIIYVSSLMTFSWLIMRNRARFEHLGTDDTYRFHAPPIVAFFLFPHNIWYHYEHHEYVTVPFYNLPKARELDQSVPVIEFSDLCKLLFEKRFVPKEYLESKS